MPSTTPTIRSLAAKLGLSRTTVSDALRSSPRVKSETAKRVWEAAAEAGYRPNPLAGAVMSEIRRSHGQTFRGGLAAIDLDEADRPVSAERFHHALIEGARRRAADLGYKLQPFLVGKKGVDLSRLDTILQSRGIQGVLVLPAWREPDISKLDWHRYAGVYTDYIIEHPALHAVCCDHYRSLTSVLLRLGRMGYRRPGLFLQRHQDERLQHRWEGAFLAYQRNHPESDTLPPLITDEYRRDSFLQWFKRHKPDVVLGHDPTVIDWLADGNSAVPGKTGFCCLNVTLHPRACAGLDLQPRLLGARSVEMLIAQLQRNERGIPEQASTTMIPALWVDGPTLTSRS
jgi:DNA-binding LacI/PurR family transcriptional regulator